MVNPELGYHAGRSPQWGIQGTGLGATIGPGKQVFYVDAAHANASDYHDGTESFAPLATLQALIDRTAAITAGTGTRQPYLKENDTIYIVSDLTESVVTGDTTDMPAHVNIVGAYSDEWSPAWATDAVGNPCLTLRALGWTVQGIKFLPGTGAAGIKLEWVPGSDYNASRTTIQGCEFDGAWSGLYGIEFSGAPYDVKIDKCEFRELSQGGNAFAIITTDSSEANAYMCKITRNLFWENNNHIGTAAGDRSFNLSLFKGNIFHEGVLIAATLMLDLRGGSQGKNIVVGNHFCGDYSNTGGYYANAASPGNWTGNFAEDVAEAEVGDNSLTIAAPAA